MSLSSRISDLATRIAAEFNSVRTEIAGLGGGGGGASKYCLTFANRWDMHSIKDWISFGEFGPNDNTLTSSAGTGVDPALEWNIIGIPVRSGSKFTGLDLIGRTNNNSVDSIDVRVYSHHGDWTTGFNAGAPPTRDLIMSLDALDFSGQRMHGHFEQLATAFTFAQDSMIVMYVRPTNAHFADRFL